MWPKRIVLGHTKLITAKMPVKRTSAKPKTKDVFGQSRKPAKMLRAGLYARVSTLDQQTLPMQMRDYARLRNEPWLGHRHASQRGWMWRQGFGAHAKLPTSARQN